MSRLFFDRYIVMEEVEIELNQADISVEEKKEIEKHIDSLIHHRVIDRLLTHLPRHHHEEFLQHFKTRPFDPSLVNYLDQRIERSVESHVKEEIEKLKKELLNEIKDSKKKKNTSIV